MDIEQTSRKIDAAAARDARNLRAWHAVERALLNATWVYVFGRVDLGPTDLVPSITCAGPASLLAALKTIYRTHYAVGLTPAELAAETHFIDPTDEAARDSLTICEDHLAQLGWEIPE